MGWFTRRVLVCLVLGFALTVASAWLPGAFIRFAPTTHVWGAGKYSWDVSVFDVRPTKMGRASAPGMDVVHIWVGYSPDGKPGAVPTGHEPELAGVWTPWMRTRGLPVLRTYVEHDDLPFDTVCFEIRGWPARAAWCEHRYPTTGNSPRMTGFILDAYGAITLPGENPAVGVLPVGEPQRVLPCRPIWSGLAIDVGFWTAVAAPLVFAPALIRRVRRRRAGSCPACGYDLTGAPGLVCPECGSASRHTAT